ncbi:MAG TPA: hypothetical protein VD761_11900 [Solirubrobacterales bacterium]|nr:hypothetical protein [Solirubrobacterales bacterium]
MAEAMTYSSAYEVWLDLFPNLCPACSCEESRRDYERDLFNENARVCLGCGHHWLRREES